MHYQGEVERAWEKTTAGRRRRTARRRQSITRTCGAVRNAASNWARRLFNRRVGVVTGIASELPRNDVERSKRGTMIRPRMRSISEISHNRTNCTQPCVRVCALVKLRTSSTAALFYLYFSQACATDTPLANDCSVDRKELTKAICDKFLRYCQCDDVSKVNLVIK